jgi:hypothetical protein
MTCICDFCSGQDVKWRYPAKTFLAYITNSVAGESLGDWAACSKCHDLIEQDDRAGLAASSIESLIAVHPEMAEIKEDLHREMAVLHQIFFNSRIGPVIQFE